VQQMPGRDVYQDGLLVPLSVGANGTTDFVWASPFTVGSLMFTPPSSEPGAHLTGKTTKPQQDRASP
jgi:hypothetical protein